jgi:APA family basic amino acid/polyamine antiporter
MGKHVLSFFIVPGSTDHDHVPPKKPVLQKSLSLKSELGLFEITLSGVGIILGAGIYVFIGQGAALSGNSVWLAFIISAIIAVFTCMSYAELSSMFPKAGAEYEYVVHAFNKRLAFIVGFLVLLSGILAAATVSLGFAGYLFNMTRIPVLVSAVALIIVLTLVLGYGVKETVWIAIISTFIELSGLAIIIAVGIPSWGSVDYFEMPHGISGLFAASALIFFAYQGFESMVKFSEETRSPETTVPKALILALAISVIIYVLVAISAVSVLGWKDLGASDAPFADIAAGTAGPGAAILISVIALFATGNTVLMSMYASSRILYGMAGSRVLPRWFSIVHATRRTPLAAILLCSLLSMVFVFSGDIAFVANVTNFTLFITFIVINGAVIALRFRTPQVSRPFRIPFTIRKIPVIPVLGIFLCIFLLLQQEWSVLVLGAVLISAGIMFAYIKNPSSDH